MYYTVIKHSSHLRTLDKCRKHSPAACVFYISLVFSNDHRVLSQCNTQLRLLHLLNKALNLANTKGVTEILNFTKGEITLACEQLYLLFFHMFFHFRNWINLKKQ